MAVKGAMALHSREPMKSLTPLRDSRAGGLAFAGLRRMSAHSSSTLDLIVETIGRLGFLEGDAAVFRVLTTQPMRTALYYLGEEIVVVGWSEGSTLYQLSATSETVARLLRHELGDAGLLCDATGVLLEVRGQEYIDDEVRRMLAM